MKKLLSILALALCFVACQNEPFFGDKNSDLVDVVLNIAAPELDATRSVEEPEAGKSSALGAIDFFNEEDWANYDIRYILEVYDENDNGNGEPIYRERLTKYLDKYAPASFELKLVPNRTYKFVVFADFVNQNSEADLYYNTSDLKNISAITTAEGWDAMNEARDAYFVAENVKVTTGLAKTLTLKRPFAKLRVVTTDLDYIAGYSTPGYVEVTYHTENVYNSFNAVSGNLNRSTMEGAELTYGFEVKKDQPYTEGYDAEKKNQTLFADYLFAIEGEQIPVNLKIDVYESKGGARIHSHDFNTQIPIQRNYLTTIVGDLLTTQANIAIEIDDNFDDKEVVLNSANLINSWGAGQVTTEGNYEFVVATADHNFIVTVNGAAVENGQLKADTYYYAENATEANQFSAVVSNGAAIARLATGISVFGGKMVVENNDNNYNIDLELNIKDNTDDTEGTIVKFNYSGNVIFEDVIANPVVTSAVEGNTITFSWDAIEGAISYFYSLNGAEFTETEETSVSFANLTWETTYTFAIYTMGEKNNSVTTTVEATTGVEPIKYNLYLKNEDNWEAVYIHIWSDDFSTEWPGIEMTKTTVEDVEYYVYTLPSEVNGKTINFLFNNGNNGKQTADITDVVADKDNFYTNYVEPSDLVLYLKPNANWKVNNARFAAYLWNDNGNTWVDMTLVEGETDIYKFTVPSDYPNLIFCRMNPGATANNWDNKWNQTADLKVPADGTNLYTIADGAWDNGAGTWSTYVVAEPEPEALATPDVKATVDVNVITLTWDEVEGASHYTVQVDDDVEETVNATTYVFEGDYEVEYMFTVKAIAADTAKNVDSEACVVTATTEASGPVAGSEVTVAEFLEMADTENEFVLTGEITRVVHTLYGNFDLTDATGTVYVYGLLTPEGTAQKQWAEAGLREGDTITIKGKYSVYNNSAQIKNATYISHVAAPFVSAEPEAINADVTAATIAVSANVAWTVKCDADWVTSYTTAGEKDGEIAVVATINTLASNRTASFTISGEGVEDFVVTLTQYAAGAVDTKGTYTSEDFLKDGTSTGGKYYMEKVNVGGTSYDCLKLGTSSVVGDYTTKAVGESGDLTLSFYAVGWNGKTSKLNVYVDGVKVGETLTLKANSGAANNSPYTITPSDETDYYSISLPGVTESSKIKFETVSGATRAIIFGVQLY